MEKLYGINLGIWVFELRIICILAQPPRKAHQNVMDCWDPSTKPYAIQNKSIQPKQSLKTNKSKHLQSDWIFAYRIIKINCRWFQKLPNMIRAHIPPSALSQASLDSSIQNQLPILRNDQTSTKHPPKIDSEIESQFERSRNRSYGTIRFEQFGTTWQIWCHFANYFNSLRAAFEAILMYL